MPSTTSPFPPITALRCREYRRDDLGGRIGPCARVMRGDDSDAIEEAMYNHLRRAHRYGDEDATIAASGWRTNAETRLYVRAKVEAAIAGVTYDEVGQEEARAVIRFLERAGVSLHVDRSAVYRNTGL